MSSIIYLSMKGSIQELISAGCSSIESIGNRYQSGHENEIQVLSLKTSVTRDQNVTHHPIEFIKPLDKSSPLLGRAISENELFEATFNLYRTNQQGLLENYYEIYLDEVSIIDISTICPHSINNPEGIPFERIFITYKSISWKHKITGTTAYSFWKDRIY